MKDWCDLMREFDHNLSILYQQFNTEWKVHCSLMAKIWKWSLWYTVCWVFGLITILYMRAWKQDRKRMETLRDSFCTGEKIKIMWKCRVSSKITCVAMCYITWRKMHHQKTFAMIKKYSCLCWNMHLRILMLCKTFLNHHCR